MSAAIGPLGVHIVDGYAILDQDGAGPLTGPAALTATVKDTDGDGRRYLNDLSLSALDYAYEGEVDISLPVHAPTSAPGDLIGAVGISVTDLLDPIGSSNVTLPDFSTHPFQL